MGPVLDARREGPGRRDVVEFWAEILESLGATLICHGRMQPAETEEAYAQMHSLIDDAQAVLVYAAYQLVAT